MSEESSDREEIIEPSHPFRGFMAPRILNPDVARFLCEADFQSEQINSFVKQIASKTTVFMMVATLTRLFVRYIKVANLSFQENGRKFFKVDDLMNKHLDGILLVLEATPGFDFNRNKFTFPNVQKIVLNSFDSPSGDLDLILKLNAILENSK